MRMAFLLPRLESNPQSAVALWAIISRRSKGLHGLVKDPLQSRFPKALQQGTIRRGESCRKRNKNNVGSSPCETLPKE